MIQSIRAYTGETSKQEVNLWWFGLMCFLIYVPLCWVRKVESFAATHIMADGIILFTIVAVVVYSTLQIEDAGLA